MCDATGLSQRRACRLTGLFLSTGRYDVQRPAADAHLSGRITELALERKRFDYRRTWQLLRSEGLHVNHKRVYRLHHLSGQSVKCRRRRKGLATTAPTRGAQLDLVDGFRHGRAGHRSQDQAPDLCGRLHEGVSDNYHRIRDFRRSSHSYSGQHCTVSRLSRDEKN